MPSINEITMTYLKNICSAITLFLVCLCSSLSLAQSTENILVELASLDPSIESTLGNEDRLYVLVHYESDIPLRFQAIAMRDGAVLDVGAIRNPAALHAVGSGDALAWVGYTNPTHIDAIQVTVLDEKWQELYRLTEEADVTWQGIAAVEPRKPAEWVESLIKTERRKLDFVYDPSPKKFGTLFDIIFFLTIASIPVYILLQLHMLWCYKYRWKELAAIPLFPYLIVAFYAIVGLSIETSLLVTFLFRYTPLALLYLVCLWLAKRFWQHKLPPPKLYKPPKT
ncbi:MAG: hypothetical protein DRH08_07815 [Deltaproteobacteria bacterium]|nr:MAG: hypothetical protein DRH08_07815 [Deltaproteobacteria bacterium]